MSPPPPIRNCSTTKAQVRCADTSASVQIIRKQLSHLSTPESNSRDGYPSNSPLSKEPDGELQPIDATDSWVGDRSRIPGLLLTHSVIAWITSILLTLESERIPRNVWVVVSVQFSRSVRVGLSSLFMVLIKFASNPNLEATRCQSFPLGIFGGI